MAKKRTTALDDFADNIVDSLFERGAEMFQRVQQQQREVVQQLHPPGTLYTCAGCGRPFPIEQCQMVDPRKYAQDPKTGLPVQGYFGQCVGCWTFMLNAGKQKRDYLKHRAAQAGPQASPQQPMPQPPKVRPPWEVLGVEPDAKVDEIRRAAMKLAAQYHDDRFNGMPSVTPEQRAAARAMFDEIIRCRDAMLKVRGVGAAPTGTTG